MILLGMVLVNMFLQSRRSQTDMGIPQGCLVVQAQMLPQHRQTPQHMAHWGMSALHIKKSIKTCLNNPYRGSFYFFSLEIHK